MSFRISFGIASCRNHQTAKEPIRSICARVLERLEELKLLRHEQLNAFADEDLGTERVRGEGFLLTIYRQKLEGGKILIVVQSFYPTLWFPNFISFDLIGKVYAEGFVVEPTGAFTEAPRQLILRYC